MQCNMRILHRFVFQAIIFHCAKPQRSFHFSAAKKGSQFFNQDWFLLSICQGVTNVTLAQSSKIGFLARASKMPPPMGMRGGLGGGAGKLGLPSSSYGRRASTCGGGSMYGPPMPPTHKKRSIPNMNKRGSNASSSGLYGLVIPPKIVTVSRNL